MPLHQIEGVEEQMSSFFEELSRLHDLPSPGMVGGPAGLRQTVYGRISRLLSSNFAAREPEHTSLDLALQVILTSSLDGSDLGALVTESPALGFIPKAELSIPLIEALLEPTS